METVDQPHGYWMADPPRIAGTPAGDYFCALLRGYVHKHNNFLAVVQGFAGLLLMDESLDSEARENITHIRDAAQATTELPEKVLAAAGCRTVHLQPVHLPEFIPLIDAGLRAPFFERNVAFDVRVDSDTPEVMVDAGRFRDILNILLLNAAEAAAAAGPEAVASLEIRAPGRAPEGRAGCVDIFVRNSGEPISADRIRDIFRPFVSTRDSRHYGLGLTVAAMLASRMNATLGVKSTPADTTFWLSIPVA